MEHHSEALDVKVTYPEQPDLAGPESMPVGQKKNSLVSFVRDAREKPPHLIEGEEFDCFGATSARDFTLRVSWDIRFLLEFFFLVSF